MTVAAHPPYKRPLGITTLFVLDIVFGVAWVGVALLFAAAVPGGARWILTLVALILAGICFAAAVGVLKYKPAGRGLNIVLAFLSLVVFPFGTILGALMLHFLFSGPVRLLFGPRHPESLPPEDRAGLPEPNAGLAMLIAAPLLALVAPGVFGIVAAIAIPNFLNAVDRGKQKRSEIDIRTLGTAIEAYSQEHNVYPVANDIQTLNDALVPAYLRSRILLDGWGGEFLVDCSQESYSILSLGKDGVQQIDPPGGATVDFNDDLIFVDGDFFQKPGSFGPNR